MQPSSKYLFINSLLAFVAAFLLTTLIHESGHFISYLLFQAQPVLHHNYVSVATLELSLGARVTSSLAGPGISLLQGLFFLGLVMHRQSNKSIDIFYLWLGFLGCINFFGYVMLTPLSSAGDTGKVAALLNIPEFWQIIISVSGLFILLLLIFRHGALFGNFIPKSDTLKERGKHVNMLLLFPVIVGSLLNAALAFPVQVLLSVIYPATSSYALLWAYGRVLKAKESGLKLSEINLQISKPLLLIFLLMLIVNRLLVYGLHF